MKKFLSAVTAAAAAWLMAVNVFAEDYVADVSEAVKSSNWGQSYVLYDYDFKADQLSKDSQIIVNYQLIDFEGEPETAPIELIVQSWSEENTEIANDKMGVWAKVAPSEYSETEAVFEYDDIIAAYGTDDLQFVNALNVGDTSICTVICTGMTITNVGAKAAEPEKEEQPKGSGINEEFVIEAPVKASGWNESCRLTASDFDSTRIAYETTVVVDYTLDGSASFSPVTMVLESKNNTTSPKADEEGFVSVKVAPISYDNQSAVFDTKSIVKAYGTGNFSELYDFSFCASGIDLTVDKVTFTDVNKNGERGLIDPEAEEPEKEPIPIMTVIIVIASIVLVGIIALFIYSKVSSSKAYDVSSGRYIKK
ncbi:MAG: hypothetical protein IJ446_03615 [Oscillospiraceae bacterium]|nr:hypothetical protein [Oscillospiraceae bacterium]